MNNLNYDDVIGFIQSIKSRQMCSNAALTTVDLKALCENGNNIIIRSDSSLVVINQDNDINRLYFYTKDLTTIKDVVDLLNKTKIRVVCDLVGKEARISELVYHMKQAGLDEYAVFQRMLCKELRLLEEISTEEVEFARVDDINEINEMLYEAFDPITAHLPSKNKLKDRIINCEILLIRDSNKIKGFTIFDSNNKRLALLDYVVVRAEYRRQRIAKKILQYKWSKLNTSNYYYLWINKNCSGFVKYHEQNGFAVDGILDYIFTYGW